MARSSTWTNADGLVVGYGPNTRELSGAGTADDVAFTREASVWFNWEDINANKTISFTIPAVSKVLGVKLKVHTAWAGASNALIVGDGSDADGFITTSAGGVANLTAGASVAADGVYAFGATDTGAAEMKLYAAATAILVDSADTDWTAGSASLQVSYI